MASTIDEFEIRHVLVGLDTSAPSMAALQVAAELAGRMKAELVGLFVEDAQILRLAGSPHACEVLFPSAKPRALSIEKMERQLHEQAERARGALASLAGRVPVQWSFRVARGEVTDEVLAAASSADVLALGRTGWSLVRQLHLGSTAMAAAHNLPRALLLVQHSRPFARQVLVVNDGSEASERALRVAERLARAYGSGIVLLTPNSGDALKQGISSAEERAKVQKRALEHLRVRVHWLRNTDVESVARAVRSEGGGILVLFEDGYSAEKITGLLQVLDSPVLLMR